jgi:hypothetical protein
LAGNEEAEIGQAAYQLEVGKAIPPEESQLVLAEGMAGTVVADLRGEACGEEEMACRLASDPQASVDLQTYSVVERA